LDPTASNPLTFKNALCQPLRGDKVREFNHRKAQAGRSKLNDCDFRHLDLRGRDAAGIDFSSCYFGRVDFSKAQLEGASFNRAGIFGVLFAAESKRDEIRLSVDHGSRMRYLKLPRQNSPPTQQPVVFLRGQLHEAKREVSAQLSGSWEAKLCHGALRGCLTRSSRAATRGERKTGEGVLVSRP
jgi:pentapeptide repeat protein